MQSNTAADISPTAAIRRIGFAGMVIHRMPASSASPNDGMYRKRSAISAPIGTNQFDTGSSVTKKNNMAKLTAGRLFAIHTANNIAVAERISPAQASQSARLAVGMELNS